MRRTSVRRRPICHLNSAPAGSAATLTAVRTALAARERDGGHAADECHAAPV